MRPVEKSPQAFRTVSEAAAALSEPAHVLRFWETKFKIIRPMRRSGGRRLYRPEDIDLLRALRHLLHERGHAIAEIQGLSRRAIFALASQDAVAGPEANAPAPWAAATLADALARAARAKARLDDLLARPRPAPRGGE